MLAAIPAYPVSFSIALFIFQRGCRRRNKQRTGSSCLTYPEFPEIIEAVFSVSHQRFSVRG